MVTLPDLVRLQHDLEGCLLTLHPVAFVPSGLKKVWQRRHRLLHRLPNNVPLKPLLKWL